MFEEKRCIKSENTSKAKKKQILGKILTVDAGEFLSERMKRVIAQNVLVKFVFYGSRTFDATH